MTIRTSPTEDKDFAHRLATYYAPEIRFDHREKYFPCGVNWLAKHSTLWCKTWWDRAVPGSKEAKNRLNRHQNQHQWILDQQLANAGEMSDPSEACAHQCSIGDGAIRHEHRLRPVKNKWRGQSREELSNGNVPCYCSVVCAPRHVFSDILGSDEDQCESIYEITYYMIYAYNGNIFSICGLGAPVEVGVHEGDLEQVVAYGKDPDTLSEDERGLLAVFMNRHSGEGRFCEPYQDLELVGEEHFVVYTARESHASYSRPSWTCRVFGFANDRHNGKGWRWQTWKNTQIIDMVSGKPKWIVFDGKYGDTDGLAQRSNLGQPGFPSRSCTLPALLPDNSFRCNLERAQRQIPGRLRRALSEENEREQELVVATELELPLVTRTS